LDEEHSRRLDWHLQALQDKGIYVTVASYADKEAKLIVDDEALDKITWANGVTRMPGMTYKKCKFYGYSCLS